jgi:hypothetical protein
MKFSLLFISAFNLITVCTFSQVIENSGAESSSMAGLNVNNNNIWSINNNIGQLANIEHSSISINLFQPFLLKDFNTASIAIGIKTENGAFGFNYSNYGNEFLQTHASGLGYSLKLGESLQSGIKLNHFYINAGEYYNSKSIITADLGLAAQLTKELDIGLIIKNPTLSKLDDFDNERVPTVMQLAAAYKFSSTLSLHAGFKKDMLYPLSFLAAIDYQPSKKIKLKGGVGTNPSIAAFGVGIVFENLDLNISTQLHQIIGWSPNFSITYKFK